MTSIKKMNKTILALGADIKNRILSAGGRSLYFGKDLGDLSQAANFELFKKEVRKAIKRIKPQIIAYDLHPNYFSSLFAKSFQLSAFPPSLKLRRTGSFQLLPVQHHQAHIASVMQEHNLRKPVIGVSFDGTGFGQDGNSWGGEFLLVNRVGFRRLAHLKYRKMPGGDKVVYQPWRMVLSILGKKGAPILKGVKAKDKELVLEMIAKNVNSPLTSSAGRLFDAAAALLGICVYALYEAEGPIKLEALCDEKIDSQYRFDIIKENKCLVVDTDRLFLEMLRDLNKGKDKRFIATKFHNTMAAIVVNVSKRLSRCFAIKDIALSGGVFQNNFLKKKVTKDLTSSGLKVFTNVETPVNDLNISLGQYYVSCSSSKS